MRWRPILIAYKLSSSLKPEVISHCYKNAARDRQEPKKMARQWSKNNDHMKKPKDNYGSSFIIMQFPNGRFRFLWAHLLKLISAKHDL